jgi:hypothetical protein
MPDATSEAEKPRLESEESAQQFHGADHGCNEARKNKDRPSHLIEKGLKLPQDEGQVFQDLEELVHTWTLAGVGIVASMLTLWISRLWLM